LTHENEKSKIIDELKPFIPEYEIIEGKISGPSKIITSTSPEAKKIKVDIENFINF